MQHDCKHDDDFKELTKFTGTVEEGMTNLKQGVNKLFDLHDTRLGCEKKRDENIAEQLAKLDKNIYGMKVKVAMIGLGVGVFVTTLTNYVVRKLIG